MKNKKELNDLDKVWNDLKRYYDRWIILDILMLILSIISYFIK